MDDDRQVEWFGGYGPMSDKDKSRVLAKCDGDIFGDECVLWTGCSRTSWYTKTKTQKGQQHGKVRFAGKTIYVTRLLFHNFVEPLGVEKPYVLHGCDTDGRCVCLKHLRAGTAKENAADRTKDGNTVMKLSDDQVRAIRKRRREGEKQRSIAAAFGCSRQHVSDIASRKRRANVV